MKLSVAMCTYNGARYLREQLESIAAQTRLPDELVVCDDRSIDDTPKMIEAFAATVPFPVRLYINDATLKPVRNFAKAISLCEGEIIALADQDDVWREDKLARLASEFGARAEAGLIFSDAEMIDEHSRPLGYRAWQAAWVEFSEAEQQVVNEGRGFEMLLRRNVVTGAAMAFRSKFRDLILPIPDDYDVMLHDYWIALLLATVSDLFCVSEPLIKYRRHQQQHTGLPPPPSTIAEGSPAKPRGILDLPGGFPPRNQLLTPLRDRLAAHTDERCQKAAARMEHLQVRASLRRKTFAARIRCALEEMMTLRYHRYSNGVPSVLHDISVPHKLFLLKTSAARLFAQRKTKRAGEESR